ALSASASTITDKRAQVAQLVAQINAQDRQMSALDERYNQAQLKSKAVDDQVAQAQADMARAQAQYNALNALLTQQAVQDYMQGGDISTLQTLVQGNSTNLALRQNYLNSATGNEKDTVDKLHTLRDTLNTRQAQLAQAQSAAHQALDAVSQARQAAATIANQEQATLNGVKGQLAVLVAQEQARQAAAQAARIQAQLAAQTYHYAGAASSSYNGPPPPPANAGMVQTVLYWANRALGKPYVYGGAGPDAFDCSGLVMWAFAHAGVSLPHSAQAQYDDTTRVPISDLQPGDLVFYFQPVDHVGIYIGNGNMIVARHEGTNVQVENIYYNGLDSGGRVG
ncbi:MAG: C40 family peptidase, partial [Acidimicrobiales bacterium]